MSTRRQSMRQGIDRLEAAAGIVIDFVAGERAIAGFARISGSISFTAIEAGTFHTGLMMTCSISSEKIGRLLVPLADHDAGRLEDLAVLVDVEVEVRDVDPDVEVAEVLRHPAPALHVGEDQADVVVGGGVQRVDRALADDAVGVQTLLLLERLDRGEHRLVELPRRVGRLGDARGARAGSSTRGSVAPSDIIGPGAITGTFTVVLASRARHGERVTEREEIRVLRVVGGERGGGILGRGDGRQDLDRVRQMRCDR